MNNPEADGAMTSPKTELPSQLLHDLRSPLNLIIGYSEMLLDEAQEQGGERFVDDLQKVGVAGRRLLALLEESFTSSGIELTPAPAEIPEPIFNGPRAIREEPPIVPGLLLIVDDDASNRDVLSRRLQRQGHLVKTASSGREALAMLQEEVYDLVLLDILMPDMNGYEVLGHIKAREPLQNLPVVMISALNEVESVVRCLEAGAEDYLTKPFNPTLLKARIGASLEKKRGRDRETDLFEQLQRNYGRLQELEKLRDDMRNMIVHDLRTPLTSVIVGVGMLERDGELNEAQREMMAIAVTGGKTLLGMINDLLDVEKMESGGSQLKYDMLSADTLVAGATEQVASLAADVDTTLITDVAQGLPPFPGDENKLSRTLVNLLANAIKFTRGGTVTTTVSQEGGDIRFSVHDTGNGIPSEAFERIFEKFGQLDAKNNVGTGLGLAFCKLAVESHGGRIHVQSTPGIGSTFSFTIPLTAAHPAQS